MCLYVYISKCILMSVFVCVCLVYVCLNVHTNVAYFCACLCMCLCISVYTISVCTTAHSCVCGVCVCVCVYLFQSITRCMCVHVFLPKKNLQSSHTGVHTNQKTSWERLYRLSVLTSRRAVDLSRAWGRTPCWSVRGGWRMRNWMREASGRRRRKRRKMDR